MKLISLESQKELLILVIFILTGISMACSAQNADIDSLKKIVSEQKENTEKAANLVKLAKLYYSDFLFDSAMRYSDMALSLSERLDDEENYASAMYRKSLVYSRLGDYQSALRMIDAYIQLTETISDSAGVAKGYYQYGNVVREIGLKDTALACYKESLRIFKELEYPLGVLGNYNALGVIFEDLQEYDSAHYYYLEAARYCEKNDLKNHLGTIWLNVANSLIALQQYDEAKDYIEKSLAINRRLNDIGDIALNYIQYGTILNNEGEYQKAIEYYLKADSIKRQIGDRRGMADVGNNLGKSYERIGEYDLALSRYKLSLRYYKDQGHVEGILLSFKNMANVLSKKGNHDLAMLYYDSALVLSRETGYMNREKEILEDMAYEYHRAGYYKQAFDYLRGKQEVADSIFDIEKARMIADLTMKYEKERDQARILKLENENLEKEVDLRKRTIQRNLILFAGLGLILIILFITLYFRQKAVKDRQIAEQRIRRLEEEKKALAAKALVEGQEEERKRIARELHDGLGVLLSTTRMQFSTIGDKSPEARPLIEKAKKLLEQASSDVRRISHNMMPGLLTKLGLYEALEDLMDQLRSMEGVTVEADIPESTERLPENKEIMIYRIMQEMINNTVKHASANNISMQVRLSDDRMQIIYSDDGVGFDVDKVTEAKTAGLNSIRSRIDFLNGNLELESEPGKGTRYIVEIPV